MVCFLCQHISLPRGGYIGGGESNSNKWLEIKELKEILSKIFDRT